MSIGKYGVSAALVTPFDLGGEVDVKLMLQHAKTLLSNGCSGLCLFGTTGEGPSLSQGDRAKTIAALVDGGVDAKKLTIGVVQDSATAALEQIKAATDLGCNTFLLAPPHYYGGIPDEGYYLWFKSVLSPLAGQKLRIILYHIPQLTGAMITPALAEQLHKEFPELVYGIKDSCGDWNQAEAFLALKDRLAILIGDERFLAKAVRLGSQGCISGLANVKSQELADLVNTGTDNKKISDIVDVIVSMPVTPAVKALCAYHYQDNHWKSVRAPLLPLDKDNEQILIGQYEAIFG